MKFLRLILARLGLILGLAVIATACNSDTNRQFDPAPSPSSNTLESALAPTATDTHVPTATQLPTETPLPTETSSPTRTQSPTSTATATTAVTVTPPEMMFIDEYYNAASAALGFGDLGDPPPLPTPVRLASLLPTVVPGDLAQVGIPPRQIWYGDKTKPRVALTFDTGQATPVVRQVLEALRPLKVHATFFLVGNWAEKNGDLVRAMVADGHELANHSYSHPNFDNLSDDQKLAQLMLTENIVQKQTGCTTRPFFRPPFGAQNKHTQEVIAGAGFLDILWTAHGGDWLPGATVESVRRRVVQNTGNGTIIILHSSVTWTAEAIPLIVNDLRARGLEVGTLSDLLTTDPAHPFRALCR